MQFWQRLCSRDRHSSRRPRSRRPSSAKHQPACIEALEDRRLLSVTAFVDDSNTLQIRGDDAANDVRVVFQADGTVEVFDQGTIIGGFKSMTGMDSKLMGGNDSLRVEVLQRNSTDLDFLLQRADIGMGTGADDVVLDFQHLRLARDLNVNVDLGPDGEHDIADIRIGPVTGNGAAGMAIEKIEIAVEKIERVLKSQTEEPLLSFRYEKDASGASHVDVKLENAVLTAESRFEVEAQASGRRTYEPIVFRKRIDKSTPLIRHEWIPEIGDEVLVAFEATDPVEGRAMLAHELVHVEQQKEAGDTFHLELNGVELRGFDAVDVEYDFHDVPGVGTVHVETTATERNFGTQLQSLGVVMSVGDPSLGATLAELDVTSRGGHFRVENTLPAHVGGDPDRPIIAGSVPNPAAGKPLLIVAEDVEGEALSMNWSDTGPLTPPAISVDASTDSTRNLLIFVTPELPAVDFHYRGPGRQRLDLSAVELHQPIDLSVGTSLAGTIGEPVPVETEIISLSLVSAEPIPVSTSQLFHFELDLISPAGSPLIAAIAIPNLIEARKHGNEAAIVVEPGLTPLGIDLHARSNSAGKSRELVVVGSKVKEAVRGGHIGFMQTAGKSIVEFAGVEIGGDLLVAATRDAGGASDLPIVPNGMTLGFSTVGFIDGEANIAINGDWSEVNTTLRDVDVIDSQLNVLIAPDDDPHSAMKIRPLHDRVLVQRTNEEEAAGISQEIFGTPFADTVLVGAFDLQIEDGARYEMHVDTGAGPDKIFGLFDFDGERDGEQRRSKGFGFVTFAAGEDADDVRMAVFGGEQMERLLATLDTGGGGDTVAITDNVDLENKADFDQIPRFQETDSDDDGVERRIARIRELFLTSRTLRFEQLDGESQANRRYLYFAKVAD